MGAVVALSDLVEARRVWRGRAEPIPAGDQPTGLAALDAVLPTAGWPDAAISEILIPLDGVGELRLVLPTLARLTHGKRPVVVIAPPYVPFAQGWRQRGIRLGQVHFVRAAEADVLWAAEQCLRSGACAAVLVWPKQADDRALRRLQVAATDGQALGFVFRDRRHLANSSPAPLRLELAAQPSPAVWVRKCRGGNPPAQPVPFPDTVH